MIEPLAFYEIGEGPPLLLVHGGFSDGLMTWGAQVKTLAGRHRLVVVDRRGHGKSPREPRPYTIAGDAADVLQVADLAGLGTFHLAGHSYGGLIAIELARRAPERIRSLHLIEPPYLALLPDDPNVARLISQARAVFQGAHARGPERFAAAFFEMILGPAGLADLRESPAWPSLVQEALRTADEEPVTAYPPAAIDDLRLAVPVQVYTGGRSHPGHQQVARRIAEIVHGARLVVVPEATHAVQRVAGPFSDALLAVTGAE